ncbi:MAG: hypothetical protein VX709_12425 [Pseudomonadota bacterium]|nr:hypothetical protein [Pseudomonadota bacterium]
MNLLRRKGITRSINVYVAKGFFEPRYLDQRSEAGRSLAERLGSSQWNMMLTKRSQIESLGVKFIEVSKATEVAPGVCATGPIERKFNKEIFQNSLKSIAKMKQEKLIGFQIVKD